MSHEMRTPLNGVIAMADVLRETTLSGAQREIVETMTTSAHLLLAQIEDVLDMAKIEAGRVTVENRPFEPARLLPATVKVILPQARYKGLAVNVDIDPGVAGWYLGDAHHLRQVILNLLANAVKFTEKGEITLRARMLVGEANAQILRVEVQDTGVGIAEAKQAAIFEPFTQADDSITRVYGGTGLGTTIARHLMNHMGGSIGLVSSVGVGSTFWIELPLEASEAQGVDLTEELAHSPRAAMTSYALAAAQPATVHRLRGARILVAEDNPTNQRVAQLILESGGHHVTIVENGEKALDALERGGFDVALFDLSMPLISGMEALKLYRFTTPTPIPVLILSANVTTEAIDECHRSCPSRFARRCCSTRSSVTFRRASKRRCIAHRSPPRSGRCCRSSTCLRSILRCSPTSPSYRATKRSSTGCCAASEATPSGSPTRSRARSCNASTKGSRTLRTR
jgi:two-component system sensor histidine kinase RpfC